MNWDKISQSTIVNGLTRVGIIVCVFCFLWQIYGLESEIELARGKAIFDNFSEWYVYYPKEDYRQYDAEENTERLAEWAKTENTQFVKHHLFSVYEDEFLKVVSYVNSSAFEMSWDEGFIPLKEGRWFEGDANEVICINNDVYELGDRIVVVDSKGIEFTAMVVGMAEYNCLPNDNDMKYDLMHSVSMYNTEKNVCLLNPNSPYNEKMETVTLGTVLVKTDNPILLSKMNTYGTCVKMRDVLKENNPDFVRIVGISLACIIGIALLGTFGHMVFGYAGIDWCVILAGYFAFDIRYKSYLEALGELILTITICVAIILIYAGIIQLVVRKKDKNRDFILTITEAGTWNDKDDVFD